MPSRRRRPAARDPYHYRDAQRGRDGGRAGTCPAKRFIRRPGPVDAINTIYSSSCGDGRRRCSTPGTLRHDTDLSMMLTAKCCASTPTLDHPADESAHANLGGRLDGTAAGDGAPGRTDCGRGSSLDPSRRCGGRRRADRHACSCIGSHDTASAARRSRRATAPRHQFGTGRSSARADGPVRRRPPCG